MGNKLPESRKVEVSVCDCIVLINAFECQIDTYEDELDNQEDYGHAKALVAMLKEKGDWDDSKKVMKRFWKSGT